MRHFVKLRSHPLIQIFEQFFNPNRWSRFQTPSRWLLNAIQWPGFNYPWAYKKRKFSHFLPFSKLILSDSFSLKALFPQNFFFSKPSSQWTFGGAAAAPTFSRDIRKLRNQHSRVSFLFNELGRSLLSRRAFFFFYIWACLSLNIAMNAHRVVIKAT